MAITNIILTSTSQKMHKQYIPQMSFFILSECLLFVILIPTQTHKDYISKMEKIIINPGLQHLAEEIFLNLDTEDLKICTQINQPCKQILENAMFWLKKFSSLSKENQKDWMKVMRLVKNSDERNAIIAYLQWNLKNRVVDFPCYSCLVV